MPKKLSASGGFAPDPLTTGSAPGPRGGSAPDPLIGSRSALAMCLPHFQIVSAASVAPVEFRGDLWC